ncbi:MAG: phosphoribosylaminoimidazolecarboxamide formyltransferase [Armatimonadetes bacterium]|jgi:AICAR transformylase/IMP cyclohydrolase PurH|nr:phosphoribosylaminoimidazolecarboxamide formyltransferase [Armatimonadota bacterium]MDI9601593.1 phosphoribosylaminoimidazolecarboxamide formyltransferase [Acidobacteriota bacterium]
MRDEVTLRYGINPHQAPARAYCDGPLPFEALNGSPGYINLMDGLNAWQLVRELKEALGLPAATSFKHVSPAGAAVAVEMDEATRGAHFVEDLELSPVATAYARARGADRMSSFGDFAAVSDEVDESLATLIAREVSDGIIAPSYSPAALEILKAKRGGKYLVLRVNAGYNPASEMEQRTIFGVTLEQPRNTARIDAALFSNRIGKHTDLPDAALRDLIVATVALKYTQSNSVCFAASGQVIGLGAGQQSRIHCTRLAASKADAWHLRHHPKILGIEFVDGAKRPDRINAIDQLILGELGPTEREMIVGEPPVLTDEERAEWLSSRGDVALSSDAFFPFRDNIDRAARSGVKYVAEPGGSVRDDAVIEACDEYGMTLCFTKLRLFHH